MSKVIKGVANAVKKVVSSPIGKALLIGATIYLGGAALGAWNSPFASVNGLLTKAGSEAAQAAAASGGGATATAAADTAAGLTTTALPPSGIETLTITGKAAAAPSLSSIGTAAAPAVALDSGLSAPTLANPASYGDQIASSLKAVSPPPPQGIISRSMSGMTSWVKTNPLSATMLLSGAANAGSPDQIDIMREQERLKQEADEKDRARQAQNLDVSGLNIKQYGGGPITWSDTGQPVYVNGIINRNRGM